MTAHRRKRAARLRTLVVFLAANLVCGLGAGASRAGGLYLSSFATPDMGTASAGASAAAYDASTAFLNPAGMTRLQDHEALFGLAPGFTRVDFRQSSDTPTPGTNGGNQGGFVPMLSSQYVHKLSERLRLGLALFSLSGASLDPHDGWTGRNQVTKISLTTLTFLPSFAVRITDWLSVGGGPLITRGVLDQNLRAPLPLLGEPTVKIKDADDWALAGAGSVLVEVTPQLRLGLLYHSETTLKLDGHLEVPSGVVNPAVDLHLELPQVVRGSGYWQATEKLALLVSGGWEEWSALDHIPLSFPSVGGAIPTNFQDTWYVAGGLQYHKADYTWQLGGRYDSSAVKNRDRLAFLPVDRVYTLGLGVLRNWSEHLRLGLAFNWADLGSARLESHGVKGSYSRNDLFLFNVSFQLKDLPWSGKLML